MHQLNHRLNVWALRRVRKMALQKLADRTNPPWVRDAATALNESTRHVLIMLGEIRGDEMRAADNSVIKVNLPW